MTRYHKALGVFLVSLFGIWGCARGSATNGAASNDKIKALEAKTAKLEDDLKNTLALKDQIRKKLSDSEDAQTQLQQEIERLNNVVKERDMMIKTRTTERDTVNTQYDVFRKNLKDLLGQAEANLPGAKPAGTATATAEPVGPPLMGGGGS